MMGKEFKIFIAGEPKPQGSKSFLGTYKCKSTGRTRGILAESSKGNKGWRADVRAACLDDQGRPRIQFGDAPIMARLDFVMPRPKSTPKKKPTPAAVKKPDLDKLIRSVFDAIGSAGVWLDDSRCVAILAGKRIAEIDEPTGCTIELVEIHPSPKPKPELDRPLTALERLRLWHLDPETFGPISLDDAEQIIDLVDNLT